MVAIIQTYLYFVIKLQWHLTRHVNICLTAIKKKKKKEKKNVQVSSNLNEFETARNVASIQQK